MNTVPLHLCTRCGRDAQVAIGFQGADPAWLCLEHFDARLAEVRAQLDLARSIADHPSAGRT